VREQTTVAAHRARATPLTTLSPPPPRHVQRFPLLCRRVPTLGLTQKRRTGEEGYDPTPSSLGVQATSPAATEERGRRPSPTTATGGGRAQCLQHGSSTSRVGGPGLEDGYLSTPEDEQLPAATQDGAAGGSSPGQSPSRGATPTSSRSSGLSYYPDDGCRDTARFNAKTGAEPLGP
jgi:hypothetical protein